MLNILLNIFFSDAEISEVRDEMLENIDFVFVPVECWNFLVKKYGTSTENTAIKRQVSSVGQVMIVLCCVNCDQGMLCGWRCEIYLFFFTPFILLVLP